jgi:O-antigen/teichoic acid export membrane protein
MDKRRLAFGTLALGFSNLFRVGLQIVMVPLMARLLGPNEFGLFALAMPTITFVMILADGGFGSSLAREPESNVEVWSSAFWALLGAGIVLGIGVIIWSVVVAGLAHQPRLPPIMAALSVCLLLYVVTVPSAALLLRHARLSVGPISDILSSVTSSICGIGLAVSGAGVWSMVASTLVAFTIRAIVLLASAPIFPKFRFSLPELRSHLTIGGAIMGIKLVDTGDRAVENALIGRSFGAGYLGVFSLAYQIPRFVCDALLNPLWLTLYVHALQADDEGRFQTYGKFARIAALILFPVATLGAAEANAVINIFLGASWLGMSPLFQLVLLTYAFSAAGSLGSALLYAKGRPAIQLRITSEAAAIRIASVMLAPWTGMPAVWLGLSAANLYAGCRGVFASCRSVYRPPAALVKPLLIPGACAICVGLVCWTATQFVQSSLIDLFLEVGASFSLYLVLLILLDRQQLLSDLVDMRRIFSGGVTK